jgi:hypothetical protein
MAEAKTKPTEIPVADFIAAVENPVRRADAQVVCDLMARVTGKPATMWGPTIVGFGSYSYRYASGREGRICRIGFSPRKPHLVFYIGNYPEQAEMLVRLGKYKRDGGCIYVPKLADIDMAVLEQLVSAGFDHMNRTHPDD